MGIRMYVSKQLILPESSFGQLFLQEKLHALMKTSVIKTTDPTEAASQGAKIIRAGGLVAFPTETVYGLGADGLNGAAVNRIFEAKGRPNDNPLILHVAQKADAFRLWDGEPPFARALMDTFWPGPLTLIYHRSPLVPDEVTAGLSTVAVRMPNNEAARALIAASGVPIAAPSAKPPTSSRTWTAASPSFWTGAPVATGWRARSCPWRAPPPSCGPGP